MSDDPLARIERRYERERKARLEAEAIAERVTAELYASVQELGRLHAQEHHLVERLREVERLKSDFLAVVSHELRTPVTVIKGMTSTLLRTFAAEDAPLTDELEVIARHTARLEHLIEDILDFSSFEAGAMLVEPETCPLSDLINEVLSSFEDDGVVLSAPSDLLVSADRRRTQQVVQQLLDNAYRHGAPPVSIRVYRQPSRAAVSVEDSGNGVPTDRTDRLYSRFAQVDPAPTRRSGGLGLGLPLAKSFVEAQGGRLWYEPGAKGARFVFTLPLIDTPMEGTHSAAS